MDLLEKRTFRKQMLGKRDALAESYRDAADEARNKRLLREEWFRKAEVLLFYVSFRSEADTGRLLAAALAEGKTVAVPRVDGENMTFFRITSMEQLTPGYQGILEPDDGCPQLKGVELLQPGSDAASLDTRNQKAVLFVPGCAFDETGGRMGYGGGFYDRFTEQYPALLRVALAYDIQLVPEVPREAHDNPVDIIVTETRTIRVNR